DHGRLTVKTARAPLSLSLVVRPEWSNAEGLRTAVTAIVEAALGKGDAATNAGMVACELAENAIKYGDWSRGTGFGFHFAVARDDASLEVVSPYDVASGSFERLQGVLRSVRENTAKGAYLARLAEVAEKSGEVGRLGLLRIAHELGANITASVENGELRVRARWSLHGPT
ncbi:MAG: hypothetical protein ABW133_08380, partial [Polyangiaceae bacterium]